MEMASIDFNLEDLSKDELITFILYAHKYDITFNEAIVKALTEFVKRNEITAND